MNYGNTSTRREKLRIQSIAQNVIKGKIDVVYVSKLNYIFVRVK